MLSGNIISDSKEATYREVCRTLSKIEAGAFCKNSQWLPTSIPPENISKPEIF